MHLSANFAASWTLLPGAAVQLAPATPPPQSMLLTNPIRYENFWVLQVEDTSIQTAPAT
jgi:hypothetical protein